MKTALSKVLVFVAFPTFVGLIGLYLSYLDDKSSSSMSFDRDFVVPFLLALAMVVVVYLRTDGFKQSKVEPILKWPKVRRVKKKVVVARKNEGGVNADNQAEEEEEEEDDEQEQEGSASGDKKNN